MVTTNILEQQMDGDWQFVLHHSSNFVEEEEVSDDEEALDFEPSDPSDFGDLN